MRDSTDRQIAELIRVTAPNASRPVMSCVSGSLHCFFAPAFLGPQGSDAQSGTAGGNGPAGPSCVPRMGVRSANSRDVGASGTHLQPPRPLLAEGQQIQS